ncbi:hypothetical protein AHAS_Ahas09G0180300 [Arachis hypogaea]
MLDSGHKVVGMGDCCSWVASQTGVCTMVEASQTEVCIMAVASQTEVAHNKVARVLVVASHKVARVLVVASHKVARVPVVASHKVARVPVVASHKVARVPVVASREVVPHKVVARVLVAVSHKEVAHAPVVASHRVARVLVAASHDEEVDKREAYCGTVEARLEAYRLVVVHRWVGSQVVVARSNYPTQVLEWWLEPPLQPLEEELREIDKLRELLICIGDVAHQFVLFYCMSRSVVSEVKGGSCDFRIFMLRIKYPFLNICFPSYFSSFK